MGRQKKRLNAKKAAKKKAKEKLPKLFDKAFSKNQKMGDRLIRRARRLAMTFRLSLNPHKHTFCKYCYKRMIPGNNCRVRIHESRVIYYCLECKKFRRVPIKKR